MEEKLPYPNNVINNVNIVCGSYILGKVNNTRDLYRYTKYLRNNFNNTNKDYY